VQASQPIAALARSAGASATLIYVVDDEQLMVEMAEVALHGQGYRVKKFTDPSDAYAAFTAEPSKPTLLLTDYAMMPWNGLELSAKCKAAHPALKILMLSGTVTEDVARGTDVRLDAFIPKPYPPAKLADTVRELLRA
jgi:DNA-binding response OmpR family regulator